MSTDFSILPQMRKEGKLYFPHSTISSDNTLLMQERVSKYRSFPGDRWLVNRTFNDLVAAIPNIGGCLWRCSKLRISGVRSGRTPKKTACESFSVARDGR
jgi:hypothetical protein